MHKGEGFKDGEDELKRITQLIQAYAVEASPETGLPDPKMEWKVVRESDLVPGTWEDLLYLYPDTAAEFHAGKIAQLLSRAGSVRLKAEKIVK